MLKIYHFLTGSFVIITVMILTACGNKQQGSRGDKEERYEKLVTEAWESKDLHLLSLLDSLEASGEMSSARADFVRGVSYDRARHIKVGESYYAKVYETTDPKKEGWDFYLEVANRLAQIRMTMSDYKGSMDVATEIMERAEKAGKLTDRKKSAYLWSIAIAQTNLGLAEAEKTRDEVYELLQKEAEGGESWAKINLLVFTRIITQCKMLDNNFTEAEEWLTKAEGLLKTLDQPRDSAVVREYISALALIKVHILEGQDKGEQAYALFQKKYPLIVRSYECVSDAADYLLEKGKYTEAADLYNHIDATTPIDNRESEMNLDNIKNHHIPRLQANLGAGRTDSVISIARCIADSFSVALEKEREENAIELAVIYDTQGKEKQIAEQKIAIGRQQTIALTIVTILLTTFFIIYTWYRRRAENRLAAAHESLEHAHSELQTAYDQLEETTAAKERIESELRIAREIQMSMVPQEFPQYEGLDMYAVMNAAKEVGGDLYGYVLQGNMLHFCLGDVSGKGVPASLFMSQSARLFRTLAAEGLSPADIAFRMNKGLAENNKRMMFVTMFIGLLHLDTGRLDFCNCGHNPPVLDDQFLKMQYENHPLGFWGDDPFDGETIDDIRGRQLLIYTDGLNEAENGQQEQFGNDHLLELMADMQNLSSREVIDRLKEAVEQHRAGVEPNDDLTLMCVRLK